MGTLVTLQVFGQSAGHIQMLMTQTQKQLQVDMLAIHIVKIVQCGPALSPCGPHVSALLTMNSMAGVNFTYTVAADVLNHTASPLDLLPNKLQAICVCAAQLMWSCLLRRRSLDAQRLKKARGSGREAQQRFPGI